MRSVTILSALLFLALFAAPAARACSCIAPPPPQQALEQADAVFVGTVVAIEEAEDAYVVRLKVDHRLKGPQQAELTVRTPTSSAACGYYFRDGKQYLIYAHKQDDGLAVSLCSRTARLADAGEDLKAFGIEPGLYDTDDTDGGDLVGPPGGRRCGGPGNAAILQTALFVLGVLVVRRRTPRPTSGAKRSSQP